MLLADGFEDTEALTTRDVLLRAGIEVVTSSIKESRQVVSSFGITMLSDLSFSQIRDPYSYDFLILPGGGRGTQNLKDSKAVKSLVTTFYENRKLLCAICAAPSILGELGFLRDINYTCFAGFNRGVDGNFTANEVEVDGNIITARSMHYSVDFALAIIEKLLGEETKEKVLKGLNGLTEK